MTNRFARRMFAAAGLFLWASAPLLAEDDAAECAVKISDWSLNRIRKDKSGANRLIAGFRVANVSRKPVTKFRSRMIFYEAMGKKLRATRWMSIREIEPGQSKPTGISQAFVPIFGSYEIEVEYRQDGKKQTFKFLGSSPFVKPDIAVGKLFPNRSAAKILGHTERFDARGRRCLVAIRMKNFGAMEATGVTVHLKFMNDRGQTVGRAVKRIYHRKGKRREGKLGPGEEIVFKTIVYTGRFKAYDVHLTADKVAIEKMLSGGGFQNVPDVEVAHVDLKRDGIAGPLTVTAKVRNGREKPVHDIRVKFSFKGPKPGKKGAPPLPPGITTVRAPLIVVKDHSMTLPGPLEPGAVQDFTFKIDKMPKYHTYEIDVAFSEPEEEIKTAPASSGGDVVLQVTDARMKGGKTFVVTGTVTNKRAKPVKNIRVAFNLVKKEGGAEKSVGRLDTTIAGPLAPGASEKFTLELKNAPAFDQYMYEVDFKE